MPQPKELTAYAPEFIELAEAIHNEPDQTVRIPCPSHADAVRLRFRLYGFQRAMRRDPAFAEAFPTLMYSELRIEGDTLVVQSRDRNRDAVILRAALKQRKGTK